MLWMWYVASSKADWFGKHGDRSRLTSASLSLRPPPGPSSPQARPDGRPQTNPCCSRTSGRQWQTSSSTSRVSPCLSPRLVGRKAASLSQRLLMDLLFCSPAPPSALPSRLTSLLFYLPACPPSRRCSPRCRSSSLHRSRRSAPLITCRQRPSSPTSHAMAPT
jgi:hypothetical protein